MFDPVPTDLIYYISRFLSYTDLIVFLSSSLSLYKRILQDDDFWKLKCGLTTKEEDQTWINIYISSQVHVYLTAFGDNMYGQLGMKNGYLLRPTKLPHSKFKEVYIGNHCIAIDFHNNVWGWGYNEYEQLGLLNKPEGKRIEPTPLGIKALQASVNYMNTGLIDMDHNAWLYGNNTYYKLGGFNSPHRFELKAKHISVGYQHVVMIDMYNNVWTYGSNEHGQLGTGKKNKYCQLEMIPALKAKYVVAGGYHTVITDLNDNVLTCGWNNVGQLGTGDVISRNVPVEIGMRAKYISAGINHTGIIDMENDVLMCGSGSWGKLGLSKDVKYVDSLTKIPKLKAKRLALGSEHTVILDLDNNVWTCGYGACGQLGSGDHGHRISPIKIGVKAAKVSAGNNSTMLISYM